jgi:hypothetical protein
MNQIGNARFKIVKIVVYKSDALFNQNAFILYLTFMVGAFIKSMVIRTRVL